MDAISLHTEQLELLRTWFAMEADRFIYDDNPPEEADLIASSYLPPIDVIRTVYLRNCSVTDRYPLDVLLDLVDALLSAVDEALRINQSEYLYCN